MKKTYFLFSIILLSALVLGACNKSTSVSRGSKSDQGEQKSVEQKVQEKKGEGFVGKLKDAMNLGTAMKCTWKQGENSYGESYVKGKNVYSEFTNEGKTGYMIMKDDCMYTWEKSNPQGIKMCSLKTETTEETGEPEQDDFDFSEMKGSAPDDMDYNCSPAVFADNKFSPPSDVKFMDLEQMFGGEN